MHTCLFGIAVAATAALGAQSTPRWHAFAPSLAGECQMVFDIARSRFVAVTTNSGSAITSSTLEWNGSEWQAGDLGHTLPVRTSFGLAYDSIRQRTILFGGSGDSGLTADLFEYDGAGWTLRQVTGPKPTARANMACAWSPRLQGVMVAGGAPNDTWLWNGAGWIQLPQQLPFLSGPKMAFHSPTQKMVLYGSGQTWLGDATSWTRVQPATNPPTFGGHAMCADAQTGAVLMFGGAGSASMWSWNGIAWSAGPAFPEERSNAGLAADLAGNAILFGGSGTMFSGRGRGDTWGFAAGGGWRLLDAGAPANQTTTLTAFDLARQRTVVVSMLGSNSDVPQVREWDGRRWSESMTTQLPELIGTAMCYDLARARTLRFGGMSLLAGWSLALSDAQYSWDGTSWTPEQPPRPTPRHSHAMACDIGRTVVVLFGGLVAGTAPGTFQTVNDTWEWNGTAWTQVATQGPTGRFEHAMAYDAARGRTLLFGGNDGAVQGDTFDWDGATWTQLQPPAAPSPRRRHSMQYDFTRNRVQLVGGVNGSQVFADHWEFDGTTWLPRATNIPSDPNIIGATAVHGDQLLQFVGTHVFVSAASLADATTVGNGCGTTVQPRLLPFGRPTIGTASFALEVYHGGAHSPVLVGVTAGEAPGTPIGYGCTVFVARFDLLLTAQLGQDGSTAFALPVPAATSLIGLVGSAQAAMLDPHAPLGLALTNGVALRIGN